MPQGAGEQGQPTAWTHARHEFIPRFGPASRSRGEGIELVAKVVRGALQNAASVASLLLTAEALISEIAS